MRIGSKQRNNLSFKSLSYENKNLKNDNEEETKTAIFGINDVHGALSSMPKLKAASDIFDKQYRDRDQIKVSSGDIGISINPDKQKFCLSFLDKLGIQVASLGNHEFDCGFKMLSNLLKESRINFVATNFGFKDNIDQNNPFKQITAKYSNDNKAKIFESYILNQNNNQYGFIGTLPEEMDKICAKFDASGILVHDYETTKAEIKKQIKSLKEKGINKIILLSHMGINTDRKLAQELDGIDVIQSAHSHDLVEEVIPSPNGDPVIIIQSGENGLNYSQLEISFNKNGIIKSANGGIKKTAEIFDNKESKKIEEEINQKFGTTQPIKNIIDNRNAKRFYDKVVNIVYSMAWMDYLLNDDESNPLDYLLDYIEPKISNNDQPIQTIFWDRKSVETNTTTDINCQDKKNLQISDKAFLAGYSSLLKKDYLLKLYDETIKENSPTDSLEKKTAFASYVANALKQETNSDLAFINISTIRNLPTESLSERDIRTEILPLDDYPIKVELTEKEIVSALKTSALQNAIPEMLQAKGLSFSFDDKLNLTSANIEKSNGEKIKLNIDSPSDDKKYSAVYGSGFLYLGGLNYLALKDKPIIQKYEETFADYFIQHLKKDKNPIILEPQEDLFWQFTYTKAGTTLKRGREIQQEALKNNWLNIGGHTYQMTDNKLTSL